MKLLHIDSSASGDLSVSRVLSAEIAVRLMAQPSVQTKYRDLAEDPLPHFRPSDDDPAVVAENEAVLAEYIDADTVIIGVPLYNFGVPSTLKTWIDRIVIAGRTFKYAPDGSPIGLVPDKRIILAVARGGIYSTGSPFETWEHGVEHLRTIFRFLGVSRCDAVVAEGLAISPEHRANAIAAARQAVADLAID